MVKLSHNGRKIGEVGDFGDEIITRSHSTPILPNQCYMQCKLQEIINNKILKKMTQKEFEELSIEQVKKLNGHQDQENVLDAWRAGYIYAQNIVKKSFQNDFQDEFYDKVEDFVTDELDVFPDF